MSVTATVSPDKKSVTIRIDGRFDFSAHQEFRRAHEQVNGLGCRFTVDMGGAEYMDSSALGMLLMLREYAGGERADVRLTNCREPVKNILAIANFQKLFAID